MAFDRFRGEGGVGGDMSLLPEIEFQVSVVCGACLKLTKYNLKERNCSHFQKVTSHSLHKMAQQSLGPFPVPV